MPTLTVDACLHVQRFVNVVVLFLMPPIGRITEITTPLWDIIVQPDQISEEHRISQDLLIDDRKHYNATIAINMVILLMPAGSETQN